MKFYNAYISWIWIVRLVFLCLFTVPAGLVGIATLIPCLILLLKTHFSMLKQERKSFTLCCLDLLSYPVISSTIIGIILLSHSKEELIFPSSVWLTWLPLLCVSAIAFIRAIPLLIYFRHSTNKFTKGE